MTRTRFDRINACQLLGGQVKKLPRLWFADHVIAKPVPRVAITLQER